MDARPMDGARLRRALAAQGRYCEGRSPLYASLLRDLERDAASSPPWLSRAVEAWSGRGFAVDWEAAHLLLADLHYAALSGRAPELAAVYPSCGGRAGDAGEAAKAAKAFLERAPEQFWNRLSAGFVQTNEVDRSLGWMVGAAAAFGGADMPFHLVELGASAGLNLIGDHLPHQCRFVDAEGKPAEAPRRWDSRPHPVLSRVGLDISPRRLTEEADRLWLKACVWADDAQRLARLDSAVEAYLRLEASAEGPTLERCAFLDAPAWIEKHLPASYREGLVVFNSIATVYMDETEYAALKKGMERVLAPWGRRGLWVELERARGADEGPLELRLHQAADGVLRTVRLAEAAPRPVEFRGWGRA